ncbi:MAG: aminotransferase class IV family protein [Synergistaceae bacterium]|nr:aminotransferase class IV family protein [Synergistaceae bacterium]
MSICYYRGSFVPLEECRIPVTDLAILRGIGVFDSIRTYGKDIFALREHIERLSESAKKCGIEAEEIIKQLPDIIKRGVRHESLPDKDLVIKPYITGGRINDHGRFPEPDFFVIFEEAHVLTREELNRGVALRPVYSQRPFPEAKSTNYLTGYVPMKEAKPNEFEALYIVNGEITESTASSFFLCKDGKIITAPVGKVLRGITREILVTLLKENNFKVEERCPLESELAQADEAFISGSIKEVLPVVRVGDQTIGNGHPGPVSKHIHKIYLSNLKRWM